MSERPTQDEINRDATYNGPIILTPEQVRQFQREDIAASLKRIAAALETIAATKSQPL